MADSASARSRGMIGSAVLVGLEFLGGCGQKVPVPATSAAERPPAEAPAASVVSSSPAGATVPVRKVREARCEANSCDYRSEICCEADPDRLMAGCQTRPAAAELERYGHRCSGEFAANWIGIGCLSSTDCAAGTRCCVNGELTHCAAACDEGEACVPGRPETCHAGSRCVASDSRSGGSCVVSSPTSACGNVRCSGDKPGCRWNRKKRRGECVAVSDTGAWPEGVMSSLDDHTALLRCASPKDCAGERCCTGGPLPMTYCGGSCMSGIDVCDTVADCPEFLGQPTGCDANPEHPPFLKTCRYRAP